MNDLLDFFFTEMLDNAIRDYRKTDAAYLLREKLEQMERECKDIISPGDLDYVYECFGLISEADSAQETYVYRKGFTDCIALLKTLGALA